MTPAFYLRVSTEQQEHASQFHAIREFCRRKGWPLPIRGSVFADKITGASNRRRELDRLLQAVRAGKFDTVIAYSLDRIGRSMPHLLNFLGEMQHLKIKVVTVTDGVDTSDQSASGEFSRGMLALAAQMQRRMIVDNTKAGLRAAAKRGRFAGRPRTRDTAIGQAKALRAAGHTLAAIKTKTGLSIGYLSDIFAGKRGARAFAKPPPQNGHGPAPRA